MNSLSICMIVTIISLILEVVIIGYLTIRRRIEKKGAVLGHESTCTSTSALYEDVRFFQDVRFSDNLAEGNFNYVFNEMFLESANLVIMTIEINKKDILRKLSFTDEVFAQLLDDDDWRDLLPSYYCEHTDVYEEWDKDVVGYKVRFRQPFIKFDKGEFDNDFFK